MVIVDLNDIDYIDLNIIVISISNYFLKGSEDMATISRSKSRDRSKEFGISFQNFGGFQRVSMRSRRQLLRCVLE